MNEQEEQTVQILTRGVSELVDPNQSFQKKIQQKISGTYQKDIVVKYGVDITRPDIHLGHAVELRKLRALQDIGCKVVFLVGDFTTQIGDPTGKSKVRPEISQQEIENNLKTYLDQVGKILKVERDAHGNILHTNLFSWVRNSDWFVGVTDIGVNENTTVTITPTNGAAQLQVPANSFLGKAVVYESTRMQKTQLQKAEITGITLINLLSILRKITHAQLIERDMFQERIKRGESLFMHEMMYPVIQAIDSVMIHKIYGSCDIEIGGNDQMFNMLMGRRVMEMNEIEPQTVMSMRLLVGLDGKEKMSKSLDNYIAISDSAEEIYGKSMSLPDSTMREYFELATYTNKEEIDELFKKMKTGALHPRDAKMLLARQITEIYQGKEPAAIAESSFIKTFQKKGIPEQIPTLTLGLPVPLSDTLVKYGYCPSKTEFRRLVDAGAIKINGEEKISDPNMLVEKELILKIGKHQFVKITSEAQ